jgi:hypothetical protein
MMTRQKTIDDTAVADQTRAEQSRAEQTRAEQSRAEQLRQCALPTTLLLGIRIVWQASASSVCACWGLL